MEYLTNDEKVEALQLIWKCSNSQPGNPNWGEEYRQAMELVHSETRPDIPFEEWRRQIHDHSYASKGKSKTRNGNNGSADTEKNGKERQYINMIDLYRYLAHNLGVVPSNKLGKFIAQYFGYSPNAGSSALYKLVQGEEIIVEVGDNSVTNDLLWMAKVIEKEDPIKQEYDNVKEQYESLATQVEELARRMEELRKLAKNKV